MTPRTADIVIIGAGAIGCSIAYHLALRGARDVVVLEREMIGAGSTSKAAGGIRGQFGTRVEIEFSLRSIEFFTRFEEEMGVPCDYRQEGYLILLSDEPDVARFRRNVDLQRSLGAEVSLVGPDDARAIVPELRVDDILAAAWARGTATRRRTTSSRRTRRRRGRAACASLRARRWRRSSCRATA